ncbi:MAG: hypothetical protein N3A59_02430 [Thermodesulfovibrionales bacterium]|nr:hypothetical protein [Thermodesulfovibrionales bacterium]
MRYFLNFKILSANLGYHLKSAIETSGENLCSKKLFLEKTEMRGKKDLEDGFSK